MVQKTMTMIPGTSLDVGELPFNVHVRDTSGRMVLYGRKGVRITPEGRDNIVKSNRTFYIDHSDLSSYIDYKLNRARNRLNSPDTPINEKQSIIKDVGNRIIHKIQHEGMDDETAEHSKTMVDSVVSMISDTPESYSGLLSISTLSSYLYDHAVNTSTFAIMLGQLIYGNSKKKLFLIGLGALLMDVGMGRVNSGILNKRGQLEEKELAHVRRHTEIGSELLKSDKLPVYVSDMALHHHERMDGSGYPDGMTGDQIRPYLRICAVADVYDALTSNRAFRRPMKTVEAVEFMLANKGQYSLDVLHALMKLVLKDDRLINMTMKKYN